MDKAPDAFRTISEVSEWLDTPTYVLRFWESRFPQIKPVKRAGGRRYYRPEDMLLLGGIKKLLHFDGHTIKGVKSLIKDKGTKHVAGFSPSLDEQVVSPVPTDDEPKIDLDSLEKSAKPQKTKIKPLKLKDSDKEKTDAPKKAAAKAVKVTVHKKGKVQAKPEIPEKALAPVVVAEDKVAKVAKREKTPEQVVAKPVEKAKPAKAKVTPLEIIKGKLMTGPFKVGTASNYNEDDYLEIEALYYSLKMVRNNMKRAHDAR